MYKYVLLLNYTVEQNICDAYGPRKRISFLEFSFYDRMKHYLDILIGWFKCITEYHNHCLSDINI